MCSAVTGVFHWYLPIYLLCCFRYYSAGANVSANVLPRILAYTYLSLISPTLLRCDSSHPPLRSHHSPVLSTHPHHGLDQSAADSLLALACKLETLLLAF